jgi:hypothetical protein
MWNHPIAKIGFLSYVAWGGWGWYMDRPVHPPDGVLTTVEPKQAEPRSTAVVTVGRWALTPRASYEITARVLGHERYHFDSLAALVPEDLALGWGLMSDNKVLESLDISQSARFFTWRFQPGAVIDVESVNLHSANTHVIPVDGVVGRQLSRLRRGQLVKLSGDLVDGQRDDGMWIKSSLVRSDTGAGACEVMLVRDVVVDP